MWFLARIIGSSGKQSVPAFGGFVSATGMKPTRKSTIDYFTPINQPFTEYCVIQELLRRSEEATAEVGQKYVLNTFDLGGCMKALPLIWKFPEKYKLHVVTPGQFHTVMNYMGMVTGHKFRGSGYAEILLEADLVTIGCLKSVLSGKAYAKALFCLKTVCEALEWLLMEKFEQEEGVQVNNPVALFNLVKSWYVLTNLPQTCGDICLQVLDPMAANKNFVFSTDCYHADSIKAQERLRRGFSLKYIIDGPATRKPADFKLFLANEDNKRQLCQLLLRVWGSKLAASRLEKCGTAVIIVDGKAYQLDSSNGEVTTCEIHELSSDQEETDTRVVLYLHYAAKLGYKSVVVRTPDSDIFFILLHHSHSIGLNIYLDIGMGKHRQIINVTELTKSFVPEYCTTLLGLYVFSGEDCTSAFKGKGKVGPLKKLQKNTQVPQGFQTTW